MCDHYRPVGIGFVVSLELARFGGYDPYKLRPVDAVRLDIELSSHTVRMTRGDSDLAGRKRREVKKS